MGRSIGGLCYEAVAGFCRLYDVFVNLVVGSLKVADGDNLGATGKDRVSALRDRASLCRDIG